MQIFHKRCLSAVVGLNEMLVGNIQQHANVTINHRQIGKRTVAYCSVTNKRNSYCRGRGSQRAIGYTNVFARLIFLKGSAVCPYYDTIVATRNLAVFYRYVSAAIYMNTVIIGIIKIAIYRYVLKINVIAVMNSK